MHVVFAVIGLIAGSILGRDGGWFYGMFAGFAIGLWIGANGRINKLQKELVTLKKRLDSVSKSAHETTESSLPEMPVTTVTEEAEPESASKSDTSDIAIAEQREEASSTHSDNVEETIPSTKEQEDKQVYNLDLLSG